MTNWRTFTITDKITYLPRANYIRFWLSDWINYSDKTEDFIDFEAVLPFTRWEKGDKIDIDTDKASEKNYEYTFRFHEMVVYQGGTRWETKYYDLLREKNNLEREHNEWRTKYYDKNRDYENYKERYEEVQEELNRLKNERINENRKNNDEKMRLAGEKSQAQIEKARVEERLESKSSRLIETTRQLENKEEELSVVRKEKENQLIMFENKLDQKSALLEQVRQSLKDLEIRSEREKGEKNAEVKEKNSELKEKEKELKRKEEEVKISQKQAGQSREKLLSEKVRLKYGKLEIFANQIGINLQQVDDLCRYCERLVHAQKNYNQANIETHESNIVKVREGLRQRGLQIEDIQKFCHKCEKIAQIRFELNEIRRQQSQYEARQETIPLYNNRIN